MVRRACLPTLVLLLAGCASAPVHTAAEAPGAHAHPPPRIRSLLDDIRDAEQAREAAAASPEPPHSAPPAARPSPPPRPSQLAATPRMASRQAAPVSHQPAAAKTERPPLAAPSPAPALPPPPVTPVPPRPAAEAATAAPLAACPELALSYCLGRYQPPAARLLARMPLERLRLVHRCELDIYMKAPALFGMDTANSPSLPDALKDHCSQDYAAIQAVIDARLRLGR